MVSSTEEIKSFLTPLGQQISQNGWRNLKIDVIGQAAAKAVQESIYDACKQAETIKFEQGYKGVIPSNKDFK